MSSSPLRIGIDTGGTFTDFVFIDQGGLRVHKEPSTPDNPAEAILRGLQRLAPGSRFDIVHGSTVATNALLERSGARTALVTTAGFEDILRIGRQTRADIYDIDVQCEAPLIPRDLCFGVKERLAYDGRVVTALDPREVSAVVEQLRVLDLEAIAVCCLHSYANPAHEAALMEALAAQLDCFVCCSHQVLPEFREYERCSTTAINAYVGPTMSEYLDDLERRAGAGRLHVLQSNGGAMAVSVARNHAVHTILSGPAGGVVGGFELAQQAGFEHVITFDMGGTSTDVSLCPGAPARTTEATIGELPVRVPVLDIHTVGAGGGSVAALDQGGALRVGPRSSGAAPGPVCYGHGGTEVTVTDANLYLGRLSSEHFLGGSGHLDTAACDAAIEAAAARAAMEPVAFAEGVLAIANATMEGAIRVISVERGHDPRDFTLVCFGGAGGMHAAALAQSLGIPRVLVPPAPGILSAVGMLLADAVRDYSRTVLLPSVNVTYDEVEQMYVQLEQQAGADELISHSGRTPLLSRSLDVRYRGQGYELNVPFAGDYEATFHGEHERRYGYSDSSRPTEIVTLRLEARAENGVRLPDLDEPAAGAESPATSVPHRMVFQGDSHAGARFERRHIPPDQPREGPALIVEYSATTVVPPGWSCHIDALGNLILEPRATT